MCTLSMESSFRVDPTHQKRVNRRFSSSMLLSAFSSKAREQYAQWQIQALAE